MGSQSRYIDNNVASQWTNPTNAHGAPDGSCATEDTDVQTMENNFTNTPFSLPATAVVYAIEVTTWRAGDGGDFYELSLQDDTITWRLKTGTAGPNSNCAGVQSETLGDAVSDMWGGTFSKAHIESANFQVRHTYQKDGKANTYYVDACQVTVYYTETLDTSQSLPAKFTVRRDDSQDLKAGFIVRQPGSQEFKAGFTAGALVGSEDFLAEFVVRQSGTQDLAASFDGQVSRDLLTRFDIRGIATEDLLSGIRWILGDWEIEMSADGTDAVRLSGPQRKIFRNPRGQGNWYCLVKFDPDEWKIQTSSDGRLWKWTGVTISSRDYPSLWTWEDSSNSRLVVWIAKKWGPEGDRDQDIRVDCYSIPDASINPTSLFTESVVQSKSTNIYYPCICRADDGYLWVTYTYGWNDGNEHNDLRCKCSTSINPVAAPGWSTELTVETGIVIDDPPTVLRSLVIPVYATADVAFIYTIDNEGINTVVEGRTGTYAGAGAPARSIPTVFDTFIHTLQNFSAVAAGPDSDIVVVYRNTGTVWTAIKYDISANSDSAWGTVNDTNDFSEMSMGVVRQGNTDSDQIVVLGITDSTTKEINAYVRSFNGMSAWAPKKKLHQFQTTQNQRAVNMTYEDLNGQLGMASAQQGTLTRVWFWYFNHTSEELLAGFIVRQPGSQNLAAEFVVRRDDSQDLKAGFIVRQPGSQEFKAGFTAGAPVDSEDLLAEFIVAAGSEDLHGELIVRQPGSQDLAASFDGQVSLNLPAELVVRQTASQDLLAEFIVAAGSEDLHGALVVRQPGSQDLAASFDAQVSPPGMEQVLFGGWYDLLPTAATEYAPLAGGYTWSGTQAWRTQLVSTDGVIKNLRAKLSGSPGAGKKYTFTLMLNGNPTALTFDIADAATLGSNMVNEILVTGGDRVSLRCVPTGTPTAVYAYWTSVFAGQTANESLILSGSGTGLNNVDTEFCQLMTAYASYSITENNFRQVVPTSGILKNLYVWLSLDPGTAPDAYRFTVRLNGATVAQSLIVTITANDTTGNDLVHSLAVVAGDVLTYMIEPLNSPSAIPYAYWGMTFVADIDGESIVMGGARSDLDVAATEYMILTGWGGRSWNADETIRHQLGQICTLKKLHILLSGSPGAGNDRDFAIRIAGTNVVTLQISDAETTGDSGALEDTVALDEYVNLRTIPTSSPNAADAYWGFVCYIAPAALQDQEELPGEFVVRHPDSEDLAAEFVIRHPDSEDLPGEFISRQVGSEELPGGFTVGISDDSEDLFAEFISRQPGSQDLLGGFIIRQSASQDLLGKFVVRQPSSQDFAAELVVRHPGTRNLPGELVVRHPDSEDLPGEFISRQAGSQDLAAGFNAAALNENLPGEFIVRQEAGLQNLLGEFIVRRAATGDLAAEFIAGLGLGLEDLPGELVVRHLWPLWTNRYWLNGVVQLEEANLSDSFLEEIITGVMDDIKTWLIGEEIGQYSGWIDIEITPRAIRRAATYGTVASLYARHIFGPKNQVVRLPPMDVKIFTTSESAMEYWEGMMMRVLELYLSGTSILQIWISTADEDPVFSMEDIPRYTWNPDDYTATTR